MEPPPEHLPVRAASSRSGEHWLLLCGALATPVVLLVLGLFVHPDERGFGTHEQLGLPRCRAMELFGVPCPGCGVTTSVTLAAHGRFLDSLATQPLGFALFFAALAFVPWALFVHFRGGDLWHKFATAPRSVWIGPATFVLAAWIYKLATFF